MQRAKESADLADSGSKDSEIAADTTAVLTSSRALLGVVAHSMAPALERVTLPQFRALVVLSSSPEPMRSGALADALGVHPSTFSRAADRLVSAGLVRRVDNPESRREILVELTSDGARLVSLVTRRRRAEIARLLRLMTRAERDVVREGFETLSRIAGEPTADDLAPLGM